jgi:hypothetical protein
MFKALLACFLFCLSLQARPYELAVAAIFQNEAPYLKEWIEFHRALGVQHFYLYNNLSTDGFKEVLKPYIKKGLVEVMECPHATNPDGGNWPTIQGLANNDALAKAKKTCKWLAILDVDEFLFPVQKPSLLAFLKDYADCAAVSVNWQMYGTSHLEELPPGKRMIECLLYKAPENHVANLHVKSIVQPQYVESYWSPHFPLLKSGHQQVNTDKVPFKGAYAPTVLIDKARINHYWTRTERYLREQKIPRRQKWQQSPAYVVQFAAELNQVEDKAILLLE